MFAKYKVLIYGSIGALLGYAYYYFIGCNSGGCPLTSTWYVTTGYGALMGVTFGFPTKSKKKESEQKDSDESRD